MVGGSLAIWSKSTDVQWVHISRSGEKGRHTENAGILWMQVLRSSENSLVSLDNWWKKKLIQPLQGTSNTTYRKKQSCSFLQPSICFYVFLHISHENISSSNIFINYLYSLHFWDIITNIHYYAGLRFVNANARPLSLISKVVHGWFLSGSMFVTMNPFFQIY